MACKYRRDTSRQPVDISRSIYQIWTHRPTIQSMPNADGCNSSRDPIARRGFQEQYSSHGDAETDVAMQESKRHHTS